MWYVIQTTTGKEEELLFLMRNILDETSYQNSFLIKAEWMKHLGGTWLIQVKPLFPGYVFIETDNTEELFIQLKAIPKFAKLLGNGTVKREENDEFLPVAIGEEEEEFLKRILLYNNRAYSCRSRECFHKDSKTFYKERESAEKINQYTVPLSEVEIDEKGTIVKMSGPLEHFKQDILQMNTRKRYAVIKCGLLDEEKTVILGFKLKKDKNTVYIGEKNVLFNRSGTSG